MDTNSSLALILLLTSGLLLALLGWWRAAGATRRRNRRQQRRAQRGEADAEALLSQYGWEVVDRQVTQRWTLWVDGEGHDVHCRADLVVASRGHPRHPDGTRLVADVKTGRAAPRASHPATRRQLLEYQLAFGVQGALLVDMEAQQVHHVGFDDLLEL